jgi:hypothetical protein
MQKPDTKSESFDSRAYMKYRPKTLLQMPDEPAKNFVMKDEFLVPIPTAFPEYIRCVCVCVCVVVEMSVAPTNRTPAVTPIDSSHRTAPNTPTPSRDYLVVFVPYSFKFY